MRVITAIVILGLVGCATDGPSYSDRWTQLEKEGHRLTSTAEGQAWESSMLPVHNSFWPQVYEACSSQAKLLQIQKFSAVAVINDTGKIIEFLVMPKNALTECFSKQMVGRIYPAPPSSPYYEVYTINLISE